PRIFPFIGHGKDIKGVKVGPIVVAPFLSFRRIWYGVIAVQPFFYIIMVALLIPEKPCKCLPLDVAHIIWKRVGRDCIIKRIGFLFSLDKCLIKILGKRL